MSSLEIHERFVVLAPSERVFAFLIDPQRVVVCLPGAELTEVAGPRTFHGTMKVKVGPVTVKYKGTVDLVDIDEGARTITMIGQGKEGASDSAKMTMKSAVIAAAGGGSEVTVDAQVEITGKLVRFGRGMIQAVSEQLFKQFVHELKARLESAEAGTAAPITASRTPEPALTGSDSPSAPEPMATTGASSSAPPSAGPGPASGVPAPTEAPRPDPPAQPINVIPVLFKALWTGIKRFFKRLFGAKPS